MVVDAKLRHLELGLICLVGSFFVTILLILSFAIAYKYFKKDRILEKEELILKNKRQRNQSINSNKDSIFQFKRNAFIIKENEDSTIQYKVMYKAETGKLALKIIDITIGGRTSCIKLHVMELKEVFFRIFLNSKTTNSIITSDMYTFSSSINVEEIFLFSLKEDQLKETLINIDIFVTLTKNEFDLLFGFTKIILPDSIRQYSWRETLILQSFSKPIDLYLKPVGYTCILLASLHDIIKVAILTSNFDIEMWISKMKGKREIYFHLTVENKTDYILENICKTSMKRTTSTVIWNEVFMFKIPNEFKRNCFIKIELWERGIEIETRSEPPTLIGSINLGISKSFPEMSQQHWDSTLNNENIEKSRWHPIQLTK